MKGKCYLKLVQTHKGFDRLSLHERLIYSYLVSRGSARQREIAEWLGIGINTVTRCCGKQGSLVVQHRLVGRIGGRVVPLEPGDMHEGWFRRFRQDERGWRKAFKYIKVYMPSGDSPLVLRDHIVLSVLYGMAGTKSVIPRVAPQYFVEVLGIAYRTARAALEDLQEHHLILLEDNPAGTGLTVTLGGLDEGMLHWFRMAAPRRDPAGPALPRIASMFADGHRPDLKDLAEVESLRRAEMRSHGKGPRPSDRINNQADAKPIQHGMDDPHTHPRSMKPEGVTHGIDRAGSTCEERSRTGGLIAGDAPVCEDDMDCLSEDVQDEMALLEADLEIICSEAVASSTNPSAHRLAGVAAERCGEISDDIPPGDALYRLIQGAPRDGVVMAAWDDEDTSTIDPTWLQELESAIDELGERHARNEEEFKQSSEAL
ncbi:hypothetical protein TA3x_005600 [Tundrisphaera sp. TA3]|uniref:hypothetical protein n=1 Tax=Tundrisphaera sp. TA3 TaxID=3435775 RepID=UPI003EBA5F08